jgi:3-phytase
LKSRSWVLAAVLALAGCGAGRPVKSADIQPAVRTAQVSEDPDDPAIWIHPSDPARSLILGTNKVKAPGGALVVFGLDGKIRQTVAGLDRPNNVDVEYGLAAGGGAIDIAVVTERLQKRLRVFRVQESGITELTGDTVVFGNRQGDAAAPMGVSLYRRPKDGAVFAIVAPKTGNREKYMGQYRLETGADGKVNAALVREFGRFSGQGEIEAVAVDDALGYVYYADEGDGIHKYHADPDHPEAARELAHFGKTGFQADREGIAIYARGDGTGFVVCTDQIPGNSVYRFYRREGEAGRPHDHAALLGTVSGGADSTDGLEITSRGLGPAFPAGLMAAMNSAGRNFLLFRWQDVESALKR